MQLFSQLLSPRLNALIGAMVILASFGLLIWLGTWQVQRMHWKEDLLARIEAGMQAEPVPLPAQMENPEEWEYFAVSISGEFDHSREILMHTRGPRGEAGYHVYTPLIRSGAQDVIVNRGFVRERLRDQSLRMEGLVRGEMDIIGHVRLDQRKGRFTPDNVPAQGQWFYRDMAVMAAHMGIDDAYPVFVEADDTANPGGWPKGGVTRVTLPNNHLGYAVTWYGLAGALAAVVIAYIWRRRKGGW